MIRNDRASPTLTLSNNLYVVRDVEKDLRTLLRDVTQTELVIVDGEPGTGKSSLLWSLYSDLRLWELGQVWLLDANDVLSFFQGAQNGEVGIPGGFASLFREIKSEGKKPILLIDTIDVPLNAKGRAEHLIALLMELRAKGVQVVAASRPGEARGLVPLSPLTMRLFDYNDEEFVKAVTAYTTAFAVESAGPADITRHIEELLEAAAQGLPIREIARNPLTLRMLFTIYAPHTINAGEVDVTTLYQEFWARRVRADVRSDSSRRDSSDADLSEVAMWIALVMLVEGLPELPRRMIESELAAAEQTPSQLEILSSRGIINLGEGHEATVSFFHQTFFEHAAAVALIRHCKGEGVRALKDRWINYDANPFLGAILERVLVLAEGEVRGVRDAAVDAMKALSSHGDQSIPVSTYVLVHRRTVPDELTEFLQSQLGGRNPVATERFLATAGNAPRDRRRALIGLLGVVTSGDTSRWVYRAFELLMRFSSTEMRPIVEMLKSRDFAAIFVDQASRYAQARTVYIRFLGRAIAHNTEWALNQLGKLFQDALKRRADTLAVQVIEAVEGRLNTEIGLLATVEDALLGDRKDVGDSNAARMAAERLGKVLARSWRAQQMSPSTVIAELRLMEPEGFPVLARLYGLADCFAQSDLQQAIAGIDAVREMIDTPIGVRIARISISRALSTIRSMWTREDTASLCCQFRQHAGDFFDAQVSRHTRLIRHVLGGAGADAHFAESLLGELAIQSQAPWLDLEMFGYFLIRGVIAEFPAAKSAFDLVLREPRSHERLAKHLITQLRHNAEMSRRAWYGAILATEFGNDEMVAQFLGGARADDGDWQGLLPGLWGAVKRLRASGTEKKARLAVYAETHIVRLDLAPEIDWPTAFKYWLKQTVDANSSAAVDLLSAVLAKNPAQRRDGLSSLLRATIGRGPLTKEAVLTMASEHICIEPDLASDLIDDMLRVAFEGNTNGQVVAALQAPMYILYGRGDVKVSPLLERMLVLAKPLPRQTCHEFSKKFRSFFIKVMKVMDPDAISRLLSMVPGLDRSLARMIVQGASEADIDGFSQWLAAIAANKTTAPEVISLANRMLLREQRISGIEKWPELYSLAAPR